MARSIDTQQSAVRGFVPAQNDEERFLMRHVEDLARAAFGRGIARYSAFLSDREQQLAQAALNRVGAPEESCRFEGGRPDAERRVLCLEPEDCYPAYRDPGFGDDLGDGEPTVRKTVTLQALSAASGSGAVRWPGRSCPSIRTIWAA